MRISDWSSDVCSSDLSAACQATIAALSVCLCSTCGRSFSPQAIPLPEWLYEEGIGESRADLVHKGEILEAYVDRDGKRALAGAVAPGRPIHTVIPPRPGPVRPHRGHEPYLWPL